MMPSHPTWRGRGVAPIPDVITEIVAGDGLTMGQVASLLPAHRGTAKATTSSVWRWVTAGARGVGGRVVRLEAAKFGGRFLTSRQALARFAAALTSADAGTGGDPDPKPRSPAARKRASNLAAKKLIELGA